MQNYETDKCRLLEDRYLFIGDEFVARVDIGYSEVEMIDEDPTVKDKVYAFLATIYGIVPRPAVTKVLLPKLEPLPREIEAKMAIRLGVNTPEVKAWIIANRPHEFRRRFGYPLVTADAPAPIELSFPDVPDAAELNLPLPEPIPEQPLTGQAKRLATIAAKKLLAASAAAAGGSLPGDMQEDDSNED